MRSHGKNGKICQVLVIIAMLGIMILPLLVLLSNNVFAQTVHDRTLNEVMKQGSGLESIGNSFIGMMMDSQENVIYLLNNGSDSISVISAKNYTKIVDDIPVGRNPVGWVFGPDKIYVVSAGSNTISVISGANYTKIRELGGVDDPVAIGWGVDQEVYVLSAHSDFIVINDMDLTTIDNQIHSGVDPASMVLTLFPDRLYIVNTGSDSVSVNNATTRTVMGADIQVGHNPTAMAAYFGYLYIVNTGSDSVSVISEDDYTKKVPDVHVGHNPTAILEALGKMYVLNTGSDSVSVIYGGSKVADIPVGHNPTAMYNDYLRNTLYIVNTGSDSVSVISTVDGSKVADIPVGVNPTDIAVKHDTNAAIVANSDSDGISVIDNVVNKAVERVTFHVNPSNSGNIICSDLSTPSPDDNYFTRPSPVGQYIYVYSGTKCIAKPNEGFEFSSWEENLRGNATQPISVARSTSPLSSFLEFLHLESPDKPEAAVNITKIGSFTANFREPPPPLPPEFWAQMYAVIATVITALFIPSIVGWIRSKRDIKRLNYYHKEIASLYDDRKLDENDMEKLDDLRIRVTNAYSEGKVNEKHYETLKGEISTLYEEIFRKKIAALDGRNKYSVVRKPIQEQLSQIKNEIKCAFSKGKIMEKHYDLLNEDISNLDGKENAPQKQAKTS